MTLLPTPLQHYITNILPTLDGWCSPEKAESLMRCVLDTKPCRAIEIGVFGGRSLFAIALAMKYLERGIVLGIDPWTPTDSIRGFESDPPNREWWSKCDHEAIFNKFQKARSELGLLNQVCFVKRCTSQVASVWLDMRNLELLHIDGNHSEQQALYDVETYVPCVTSGGTIYFDDCDWLTTKRAQQRLLDFADPIGTVSNCGIYRRK